MPGELRPYGWIGLLLNLIVLRKLTAAADVTYTSCALKLQAVDDATLDVSMDCSNGLGDANTYSQKVSSLLDKPIPFPGTPVYVVANGIALLGIWGNSESGEVFEISSCHIQSLPADLESLQYLMTVADARVVLRDCNIPPDADKHFFGTLYIDSENEHANSSSEEEPMTGPMISIYDSSFTGGVSDYGAVSILQFPYVKISDCVFLHSQSTDSQFINRRGGGVVIISNTTFEGPSDPHHQSKALFGTGNGKILVEDCRFTDMNGVIDWIDEEDEKTDLIFRRSSFTGNEAANGAVMLLESPLNVTVEDCDFENNIAGDSGAIFNVKVVKPEHLMYINMRDSRFSGNSAVHGGSVIYLNTIGSDADASTSEITMENCTVGNREGNSAVYMEGAGFVNLTVIGGEFKGNSDKFYGAALNIEDLGTVLLNGTVFEDNSVTSTTRGRLVKASGGAVKVTDAKHFTVDNCIFKNNKVVGKLEDTGGGAIYFRALSSSDDEERSFLISSSTFEQNTAGFAGGAILLQNHKSVHLKNTVFSGSKSLHSKGGAVRLISIEDVILEGVSFIDNSGYMDGGGLAVDFCSTVMLTVSTFTGNVVTGSAIPSDQLSYETGGGAVYINGGQDTLCQLTITDSTFSGSSSFGNGGLLLASGLSDCTVSDTRFSQDSRIQGSGGVAMINSIAGMKMLNCDVDGGQAALGGGIHLVGDKITVENSNFRGNTAVEKGGALYLNEVMKVSLISTSFTSNNAKQGAGAWISRCSEVTILDGKFAQNKCSNKGGAIYIADSDTITVSDSDFLSNQASDGGALFIDSPLETSGGVATFECSGSTFDTNSVSGQGGSISLWTASANIQECSFTNCVGEMGGGCIKIAGAAPARQPALRLMLSANVEKPSLNIADASFSNAEASEGSGGVVLGIQLADATFQNLTMDGGSSTSGGGMSIEDADSIYINSAIISNSRASADGGGLRLARVGNLQISDTVFDNNKAEADGGSLFLDHVQTCTIGNSNFTNSNADGQGGAIHISDSSVQMSTSSINRSSAEEGGAFAVIGSAELLMTDTNVVKSSAKSLAGGVAALFSCDAKVTSEGNCTVEIPFQTGHNGMSSKNDAIHRALLSDVVCEGESDPKINFDCDYLIWKFGGMDMSMIFLCILLVVMGLVLLSLPWMSIFSWKTLPKETLE